MQLRRTMVQTQLMQRGISDPRVLDAMRSIPRESFVLEDDRAAAYEDRAIRIDCGQTISQPYMVARMTELLELQSTDRVLEIGTGCGYQTAVLARLARDVYTIEWHEELSKSAKYRLTRLGAKNIHFRVGDGTQGWPDMADFDAIIVTAGGPEIPAALQQSLAMNGRMVIPLGQPEQQHLVRIRRTEEGFPAEQFTPCRFVPLRTGDGDA